MATSREYAYYIKGSKLCVVEKEANFDNDPASRLAGPGVDRGEWKSPLATVEDALRIEYTYVPTYLIESTDTSTQTISGWDQDNDGYFRLRASGSTDWTSSPNLSSVTYIVLKDAGRFNGLHKIKSVTNNRIVTTTRISGSTSETLFERTVTLYYDVSVLQVAGEDFDLDVPTYLEEAIIYYMKARLAEDAQQIEQREYFMNLFKKRLESHNNSRIWGARIASSGPYAIR